MGGTIVFARRLLFTRSSLPLSKAGMSNKLLWVVRLAEEGCNGGMTVMGWMRGGVSGKVKRGIGCLLAPEVDGLTSVVRIGLIRDTT